MGYITTDSEYLAALGVTVDDNTQALIDSASAAIDAYLGRGIEQTSREKVFVNRTGEVFLTAYPVDHVSRVCIETADAFTITGTGQVATFAVGESALKLTRINNGSVATTSLAYGAYPTISALVAALPTGFSGVVAGSYGAYPSTDLVRGQSGNCKVGEAVRLWIDGGAYSVDHSRGIVSVGCKGSARIVWLGGFATVPADLQQICAELVANRIDAKKGAVTSESLGEYSYTIGVGDLNRLPVTAKGVLDSYRNRGC